ncbi:hypothetical protein D3C74_497980 [compost metagenome]
MQKVNPWLPMTHGIAGYKASSGSGDSALMIEQIVYLLVYAVIFLALTFLYFARQNKRTAAASKELAV